MHVHRLSSRRARNLRQRLLIRDGNQCIVCKRPFDPTLDGTGKPGAISIKRVVPIEDGGTHAFENLRLAHRSCNVRRDIAANQLLAA